MRDRAGRGPVVGAEGALHATWREEAGGQGRDKRAALPEAPRALPRAGRWRVGRTGAEAARGLGLNQPPPHLKKIFPIAFANPLPASAQPPAPQEMPSTAIYRVRQN